MTQFDIFHVFVEIQWTMCFAFSELYSNPPKSEFDPKMPMFEQLKKTSSSEHKQFFDPIRKILIWTFWDYKGSWSKKSAPIQP